MTDSFDKPKTDTPAPASKKPFPFKFRVSYVFLAILTLWVISIFSNGKLPASGSVAPAFVLRDAENNGGMVSLESFKGKTVVLDFWGIGCPPCMQEIFELEAIWREMKDQDVAVVGVSAWGENRTDVLRLKRKKGATYLMLVGTGEMTAAYKVTSLPTLFIIDPEGKIAYAREGFWDRESLKKAVLKASGK